MPHPSADATPLVRAFSRELARAGGLLSPDYLASGLSVGEARCLYELGHAEGLEVSALADRLDLDLGHVSRIVSRLAARRLVSKRIDRRDARARSIVITAKGARQLAVLDRHANRRLGAWLASKPAPVVDRLLGGLRAVVGDAEDRAGGRIVVRVARPGSIGHIIARHGETYTRDLGYPAVFEHHVVHAFAAFLAAFAPPRDRIWIAEQGGRFVGCVAVKGLPGSTAQLRFLLVEPEARGRGLGRRLVARVLAHARTTGDRRVVLDTASDLEPARAIYASVGFRRTASVAGEPWLPRGVDSERWELELTAAGR
jgi:DNA-binding MarR family transcriptional regulator/ribosomal protein S18 acetylase RimI-like enzyme